MTITVTTSLSKEDLACLKAGLDEHAAHHNITRKDITFLKKDDQTLIAGLSGSLVGTHLHLKLLWVQENRRGKGIGRLLVNAAISYAKENKIKKIFIDTLEYQAPNFYTKLGFKEITRIQKYYPDQDRIFYAMNIKV